MAARRVRHRNGGLTQHADVLMSPQHLSDDDLERLALDRLPKTASEPAEEHLLTCAECRERLAGWDQ